MLRGCCVMFFSMVNTIPDSGAPVIGHDDNAAMPPFYLLLSNQTGAQTSGFHYDLVFPQDRVKRPRQIKCVVGMKTQCQTSSM